MIFIEIRCDNRNENNPDCDSTKYDGEMTASENTQAGMIREYRLWVQRHINDGWVKRADKIYCPSCAKFLKLSAAA